MNYPAAGTSGAGEPSSLARDTVQMFYNNLGEQVANIDQNGTSHRSIRDAAGRSVADRVESWGTVQDADSGNLTPSLDNTTKQLTTHYDPRGRVWAVISHNATYDALTSPPGTDSAMNTVLQGSAVQNFIKYDYNHRGLITRLRQGPRGSCRPAAPARCATSRTATRAARRQRGTPARARRSSRTSGRAWCSTPTRSRR
ncbi:MAG: hypothetical protein ACREJO_09375 [Phycisphaerales bacterium]